MTMDSFVNKINNKPVQAKVLTSQAKPQSLPVQTTEDKQKSNAAKYMIGATAAAVIIAAGLTIVGRKGIGPLKCLAKGIKPKMSPKEYIDPKTGHKIVEGHLAEDGRYARFVYKEGNDSPSEIFEFFADNKTIESRTIILPKGALKKVRYNEDGSLKTMGLVKPETSELVTVKFKDNKISYKEKVNVDNNSKSFTYYRNKRRMTHIEHDTKTNMQKSTLYQDDGKTIKETYEFWPGTTKEKEHIVFHEDGKTPWRLERTSEAGLLEESYEFNTKGERIA